MLLCLILSIIRYGSRVKWSKPGNGAAPSPTLWCCSYWKRSLWATFDYSHQLYLQLIHKGLLLQMERNCRQAANVWILSKLTTQKLATLVEDIPKASFSIATTPRCSGGHYSIPWIAPLYPWSVRTLWYGVLSKKASSTIFWVFGTTRPGIKARSPGPLVNTLLIRPMDNLMIIGISSLTFQVTIIWKLQVQSRLQTNTGIFNTCICLWLTESEQANPVD